MLLQAKNSSPIATEFLSHTKSVADNYLYSSMLPSVLQFVVPNTDPDESLQGLLLQAKNFSPIATKLSSRNTTGCRQLSL